MTHTELPLYVTINSNYINVDVVRCTSLFCLEF